MGYTQLSADLDTIKRKLRRVLLNGPPNSRKTSALRTWPGPVMIQCYPKEKGTASIPFQSSDGHVVTAFAMDDIDVSKPQNWAEILQETMQQTYKILSGQCGPCTTFAGDGLHKLYQIVLASLTNGANFTGEDFEPKIYSRAHAKFWEYLDKVLNSPVDYVVMTCWDGAEVDNQLDQSKEGKSRKHVYPDLPGQAAKKIMGEFSMVLNAGGEGVGQGARFYWQTRPQGWVWGAGIKLPVDLIDKIKIPVEVEQDFTKLDRLIMTQLEQVWQAVHLSPGGPASPRGTV